jgi:hypothetical protein
MRSLPSLRPIPSRTNLQQVLVPADTASRQAKRRGFVRSIAAVPCASDEVSYCNRKVKNGAHFSFHRQLIFPSSCVSRQAHSRGGVDLSKSR